jgi:serine/threonine-protein kinase HipA
VSNVSLGVWHGGTRLATLTRRQRPWQIRCRYERDIIASGANQILISCSLPVSAGRLDASPWIRGLLPEGEHLIALATQAQKTTMDFFGLINRYGRDLSGALTIAAEPEDPGRWDLEQYSDESLAIELRTVSEAPGFAIRDDSELSIAGLQNKLLVAKTETGWARPMYGYPSTHIFKLGDSRFPGIVRAEHVCMQFAAAVDLSNVATSELAVDGLEVLSVERYDRIPTSPGEPPRRIHQEDACQALAINIDAHGGRGKYEAFGGPGFRQIATLLDRFGDPATQLPRLLEIAIFTWLIGNADGHGKNISLLIDTNTGRVRLAPLYDTVPTFLWPQLRATMAMSINGVLGDPTAPDFIAEARSWGLGETRSEQVMTSFLARASQASVQHDQIAETVAHRVARLQSG